MMRDFEQPRRSVVIADQGMAATSHPLATGVAVDILKRGGNAMDAAIAACAVQAVVEPQSTGIGGDCFALYAPRGEDRVIAYNGSGRAPRAATPDWYAARGITAIERSSPHAVTVPGAVEAWARLARDHGTLPLGDLLAPAIAYAERGYPVAPRVVFDWRAEVEVLARDPDCAAVFLPGGKAPEVGDRHRQPLLAATLRKIAAGGAAAFYEGDVAADAVEKLRRLGGLHTLEDFATATGDYVTPIRTSFRGHDVIECPPNGQGVIALMLLGLLEGFAPGEFPPVSAERYHREIEAARLVYDLRDRMLADPDHLGMTVEDLLAPATLDALRARIDPARARLPGLDGTEAVNRDTVYITVVDKDRNAVSLINSVFFSFGTGIMAPKSGFLLHNRGSSFRLDPAHPNCIGPGKRPMHTIIPAMLAKQGRIVMPFGVMGGHFQAIGHAHVLTRMLEDGLAPQSAIDLPRLFPIPGSAEVEYEGTVPEEILEALRAKGHRLVPAHEPVGGAQAIWIDGERGVLVGASDPRKDGCALGY